MTYSVLLTDDVALDLKDIYDWIFYHDSSGRADRVLDRIETAFESLSHSPERGPYPKELLDLGIKEFPEIFFTPYRMIYRVIGSNVYILLIADGRRDMGGLLQKRLLHG